MHSYKAANKAITVEKNDSMSYNFDFEFEVPEGCLCVVGTFLRFYSTFREQQILTNRRSFSPGAVVAAVFRPGLYTGRDNLSWANPSRAKSEQA